VIDQIDENVRTRLQAAVAQHADAMIGFAQRAIQTRSLPGEEQELATLVKQEMERLGYDEVWIDRVGNVIGVLKGQGQGRSVQFNAHLDHVHEGDPALWPYPPYAGVIHDGVLYGRGACDVKGALAAQVYLVPVLRAAELLPRGDIVVAAVVLEELGGLGTQTLCQEVRTDVAVLGEPTRLELRHGHRGRLLIEVDFVGRSAHASMPEEGANPLFSLARFLLALEHLPMVTDPVLGPSSVAPTLLRVDQTSSNVTPAVVTLSLDWRNVPADTPEAAVERVQHLARECCQAGITAQVRLVQRSVRTYTGIEATVPPTRGFLLPADHLLVRGAQQVLQHVLGRAVPLGVWRFATDGGHLMHAGIPTIGFAPGDDRLAHTVHDQVSLAELRAGLLGYAALALHLSALEENEEARP